MASNAENISIWWRHHATYQWVLGVCVSVHDDVMTLELFPHYWHFMRYSISQAICTRFCCALLCCGYAIVHNEFTWSIYPYSSGLLCWHWAIVRLPQCQWSKPDGYGKISQCITTLKAQQSKNRVHIYWDILYLWRFPSVIWIFCIFVVSLDQL